jgi:hypothetical protein
LELHQNQSHGVRSCGLNRLFSFFTGTMKLAYLVTRALQGGSETFVGK